MNKNYNVFIEKTENSKFVVIEVEKLSQLIHYQVQMIANNDIRFLLKCSVQQMNGMVRLYYDITNKISLEEYRDKFGFTSEKFMAVIKSLVEVDNEIDEYQLVNSGILFDLQWSFVDNNGENVEYIYIPDAVEENDASDIKNFIANMLINGYANTNDQLLTANLFMLVKDKNSSLRDLRDLIYKMEGRSSIPSLKRQSNSENKFVSDEGIEYNQQKNMSDFNEMMKKPQVAERAPIAKKPSVPAFSSAKSGAKMPKVPKPSFLGKGKNSTTERKEVAASAESINIAEDKPKQESTLPRTLFILGNVVAVALIVKLFTLGFLSLENGEPDITKLAALLVAVVVIDVIVVKNLFLSKGEPKPKKEKAIKPKKEKVSKWNKKSVEAPENKTNEVALNVKPLINKMEAPTNRPSKAVNMPEIHKEGQSPIINNPKMPMDRQAMIINKPEIPKKEQSPIPEKPQVPNMSDFMMPEKILKNEPKQEIRKPESPVTRPEGNMELSKKSFDIPLNNNNITENDDTMVMTSLMSDEFGDETMLMETNRTLGYIERIEDNKAVDKYIIKKDSVIIGRLRSQVDMIVLKPTVSKMHAEISFKNDKFYIKDLGSRNGTYLQFSNSRIENNKDYEIKNGEKFKLADCDFCVHFI